MKSNNAYCPSLKAETFDDLYQKAIELVRDNGIITAPRGLVCREVVGARLVLTNPYKSWCSLSNRKLNYAFGIVEMIQYLAGVNDPGQLCAYNSRMKRFINPDTNLFDSAYGPRIHPQLTRVYELLTKDPDSRQAVISIYRAGDAGHSTDVPCTISLQFLLRDDSLVCITTMRSNDLLWGLPYDLNAFCFLQRVLASWLNVKVGDYIHQPASLHYYSDREEELLNCLVKDQKKVTVPPSEFALDRGETSWSAFTFLEVEAQLRKGVKFEDVTTIQSISKLGELFLDYLVLVDKYLQDKREKAIQPITKA